MPGAASAFIHFDCFQLVLGARCAGALLPERVRAPGRGAPRSGCRPSAAQSPAEPRAPGGWAEKIISVLVIFPGNLSFRTYTCAYLVGGASSEPVFSQLVLGLGFRELPSPPSNGGVSFQIGSLGQGPTIEYPLKLR